MKGFLLPGRPRIQSLVTSIVNAQSGFVRCPPASSTSRCASWETTRERGETLGGFLGRLAGTGFCFRYSLFLQKSPTLCKL